MRAISDKLTKAIQPLEIKQFPNIGTRLAAEMELAEFEGGMAEGATKPSQQKTE